MTLRDVALSVILCEKMKVMFTFIANTAKGVQSLINLNSEVHSSPRIQAKGVSLPNVRIMRQREIPFTFSGDVKHFKNGLPGHLPSRGSMNNLYNRLPSKESSVSQKHGGFVRSPDTGLLNLTTFANASVNPHILVRTYHSNSVSFSEIFHILLSCLCIGASGIVGSTDVCTILNNLPSDFYLSNLNILKEKLLFDNMVYSCFQNPSEDDVLKITQSEILYEIIEKEIKIREEELKTPEGRSKKAIAFLVGSVVFALYLAVKANS